MIRAEAMRDYVELCKPRLTAMAVLTAAFGFFLGGGDAPAAALIGAALAGAGAAVLNMVMERDVDARMRRTQSRPIPAGRVAAGDALVFGALLSAAGVAVLALGANPLAGALGAATIATYLFAYTPLKRVSSLAIPVGAVSGALPPLIGWSAATGGLGAGAWILFAVLFLWQLPHFLAIAWLYREDYARAGLPVLPAGAGRHMVGNTLALVVVSLAPYFWFGAGPAYLAVALALGAAFLAAGIFFCARRTVPCARAVFLVSLVYLPALLALMAGGF